MRSTSTVSEELVIVLNKISTYASTINEFNSFLPLLFVVGMELRLSIICYLYTKAICRIITTIFIILKVSKENKTTELNSKTSLLALLFKLTNQLDGAANKKTKAITKRDCTTQKKRKVSRFTIWVLPRFHQCQDFLTIPYFLCSNQIRPFLCPSHSLSLQRIFSRYLDERCWKG
jgi:hypothetical protein